MSTNKTDYGSFISTINGLQQNIHKFSDNRGAITDYVRGNTMVSKDAELGEEPTNTEAINDRFSKQIDQNLYGDEHADHYHALG